MKRFLSLFLTLVLLLSFTGCVKQASDYTEAEHIQRVKERTEKRYKDSDLWDGSSYESFEVYPLYNENEELTHFLVEFEPYGFMFVTLIKDGQTSPFLGPDRGMYLKDLHLNAWSPYKPIETKSGYNPKDYEYILDENGEMIYYDSSPFKVAEKMNERKYMLKAAERSSVFVCAVKSGDKFINLMNDVEVDVANGDLNKPQAILWAKRTPKEPFVL